MVTYIIKVNTFDYFNYIIDYLYYQSNVTCKLCKQRCTREAKRKDGWTRYSAYLFVIYVYCTLLTQT